MAKLLITPVASSGVDPFVVEGRLSKRYCPGYGLIYYINDCASYPEEIVTVLDEDKYESKE